MNIKQILSALVASALLVTSSLTANAADYHYSGNQDLSDNETDFYTAFLANITQYASESPFLPLEITDSTPEGALSAVADVAANTLKCDVPYKVVVSAVQCYHAYADFVKAVGEGFGTWKYVYDNKITYAYNAPVKTCFILAENAMASGAAGKVIPDSVLEGCQKQVDSSAEYVKELRSFAKNGWYAIKSNEVNQMANSLEELYKSIDIKALYQIAYKNSQKYSSIYNQRTIGESGALATVGMAHGKLKGSRTSEYDVYCANKYREDIYWWCTESALNLDDQVTKFSSDVGTSDKINKLISLASNAQSGLVVQVNKSDKDQLRYLLGIGGADGDLLVLDPISGSCVPISFKELCSNYGLDYNTTVSRICSVWSYVWA